jgi:Chaperone of endosialidase
MKKLFVIFGIGITSIGFAQQFNGGATNTTTAISRTGTIGVGTVTVPTAQIHVQTAGTTQLQVERSASANQDNALKVFFTSSPAVGVTVGGGSAIFQATNPNSISDMLFQPTPTSLGMVIKSSGNVGIGELSPLTKLGIKGDNIGLVNSAGAFGSSVSPAVTTGPAPYLAASKWLSLGARQPVPASGNTYGVRAQWASYAVDLVVQERAAAGTVQDAGIIWQDGRFNTDICTTTLTDPSALKFVFRNGATPSNTNSSREAARFVFKTPTFTGSTCGNLAFLGINNANPIYELDVTGKINASSQVLAAGLGLTSDRRFKKDIISINNGIELIRQLNPVNYTYRVEEFKDRYSFDDRLQYGFIAQDLEKVMPSSIIDLQDGYKAVNYIMIIPVLTNAIKTMDAELQALKGENAAMRKTLGNSSNSNNTNDANGSIKLLQNVPNPFGNSTLIQYELGNEAKGIKLVVADLTGKTIQVFDNLSNSGKVEVSAESLNNGIYIYSLVNASNEVIMSKQMLVQK